MSDKSFSEEVARIFEQVASPEEWVSAMDILRERFPKTDVDLLVRRLQKERPYREAFDRQLEIEHARTKEWTIPVIEELLATIPEFQASDYFDRGFAEDGLAYAVFDVGGFYSFLAEAMNRRDEPLTQRCFDFLENLANRSEDRLNDLLLVTFFENLGWDSDTRLLDEAFVHQAQLHMGPYLRRLQQRSR
jgi:hypothetical protein